MKRTSHPFHMYDAILAQPKAFYDTIGKNKEKITEFASKISACERLFLIGIGTSHHATQIGEYLMKEFNENIPTYACHSFDFVLYPPKLTNKDCIINISHRGNKTYSIKTIELAQKVGAMTALITGEDSHSQLNVDEVFNTVGQEKSSAHTISYVGSLAVLFQITKSLSDGCVLPDPEVLNETLNLEQLTKEFAQKYAKKRRIWIVGGGVNGVTAQEIALKIKETSYLQAEGMSIETMFHGPFQCVEAEDLFVIIAPKGKSQKRCLELIQPIKEIGADCLVVGDGSISNISDVDTFIVPETTESVTALTCLLPLQLFTYYLALEKGTNPDSFRLDDERFEKAYELNKL